jgi:gamma-glutamyltranspeptidase
MLLYDYLPFPQYHLTAAHYVFQDAAVAVIAALNVTEPSQTGIGGDMFCLFYNAKTKKVHALNGSGRSASKVTLEQLCDDLGLADKGRKGGKIPWRSVHGVTVPGAAAGWVDTVEKFGSGKLSLDKILAPAIELADTGFPVSELSSYYVSCLLMVEETLNLTVYFSGKQVKLYSEKHHLTDQKCSRKTEVLKMDAVLPNQGR